MESSFVHSVSSTYSHADHLSFPGLNSRIAEELDSEVAQADRELGSTSVIGRADQEMSMDDDEGGVTEGSREEAMQLEQTEVSMVLM
jgi:hypothetical protein